MNRFVELRLGGSPVLLGRRVVFPPEVKTVDPIKRTMLLRRMSAAPEAMQAIRHGIDSIGLPVTARQLEDAELLRQIEGQVERGRLVFVSMGTSASQLRPQPYRPPIQAGARDIGSWTAGEKIEEALRRAAKLVPGEIGKVVEAMLSPEAIVTTVGMLVALAAANAMGVGLVLDGALAAYAFYAAGMAGIRALGEFVGATGALVRAREDKDIDRAAAVYAATLTVLGTAFLQRFMKAARRKAGGGGGGGSSKKSDGGDGAGPSAKAPVGRRTPTKDGADRLLHEPNWAKSSKNPPRSKPATINGQQYSGHALDRMQERGLVPSVVENAIKTGTSTPVGKGVEAIHDNVNNITVIMNSTTKNIITVY